MREGIPRPLGGKCERRTGRGLGVAVVEGVDEFFAANAGSATGVWRDPPLQWALAVGNLSHAALLTLAVGSRVRSSTIAEGFRIGAIVGFLVWLGVDFILYGVQNVSNLTATVVDALLGIVPAGIAGAVVAAVLGKMTVSARAESQLT